MLEFATFPGMSRPPLPLFFGGVPGGREVRSWDGWLDPSIRYLNKAAPPPPPALSCSHAAAFPGTDISTPRLQRPSSIPPQRRDHGYRYERNLPAPQLHMATQTHSPSVTATFPQLQLQQRQQHDTKMEKPC